MEDKKQASEGDDGKKGEHKPNEDLIYISKNGNPDNYKLDNSGAVVGLQSFEDVLDMLGPFGRWTIITMFFLCTGTIFLPFQSLTYEFLGHTPDYWCQVEELNAANWSQDQIRNLAIPYTSESDDEKSCQIYRYNYTKAVELGYETVIENPDLISDGDKSLTYCKSRFFNISDYSTTLVAEWDLVCERRVLYATSASASQMGILIGVLSGGYLMDAYGRRPIILISLVLSLVVGLGAAIAPSFPLYIIMKILVSCFNYAYATGTFVYQMEISSPSQRSSLGAMGGIFWSISIMIVPGIAYMISPWRWLQAAYTLPTIFFFSSYWTIPESPRWLISQGRYEEAAEIINKAAKMNKRTFPPKEALINSMKKMIQKKEEKPKENLGRRIMRIVKHFFILVIKPEFRKKAVISYFCWFAVSMVYYGISLNSGNLSTDPYIYIFLGGLTELPSYFIVWLMISKLGRKKSLSIFYLVCGVCICIVAILLVAMEEVPNGLLIFLSLTGKTAIVSAFIVVYVYTAELFPTRFRSLAVGESSTCARVGSIMSPYINDLFGATVTWGPSALFAVMSAAAATLTLLQPETRDAITEDSPEDSENQTNGDTKLQRNKAHTNEAFESN